MLPAGRSAASRIDGDAGALEQVFVNLLVNAAHALTSGGEARVTMEATDAAVTITVRDTGIGMDATTLDRVSMPFHSSKRDGTGLGLKIARRIVQSHGGTMEIESEPGVGTCVTVVLPRQPRGLPRVVSQERDGVAV